MNDTTLQHHIEHRFGGHIPKVMEVVHEFKVGYHQALNVLDTMAPELPGVRDILPLPEVPILVWSGCYGKSWKGHIHEDSFMHPAKYSRLLIEKIIRHGLDQGYWKLGDVIGDPFGGVGLGGLACTDLGLKWVGNELEPKFHDTALRNFARHQQRWMNMGRTLPQLHLGDSRNFDAIVDGMMSSPPYCDTDQNYARGGKSLKHDRGARAGMENGQLHKAAYESSPGQIAGLGGKLSAAVASPPYAGARIPAGGHNAESFGRPTDEAAYSDDAKNLDNLPTGTVGGAITSPPYGGSMSPAAGGADTQHPDGATRAMHGRKARCGGEEGNIANLSTTTVAGAVTSPPWEDMAAGTQGGRVKNPLKSGRGKGASDTAVLAQAERDKKKNDYGNSEGQIGRTRKETYWEAMRQVYEACFRAIAPGGYFAVVVKDYVKKKKRVCLCDDTLRLLTFVGFDPVERVHAMLFENVHHHAGLDLLGNPTKETAIVQRKSFFKRVHESKPGAVKIDWEEVIFVRKPTLQ